MHEAHVVRHILLELRGRDVDVLEEAHRHRDERLARPRVEPVDDRGRDERGELAASVAERVAHRRHAEHHVQVLAHAVKEKVPANVGRVHQARRLDLGPNGVEDVISVVRRVQVGDEAAREQIVEVDEHALINDLLVGEEPHDRVALEAGGRVESGNVGLEVEHAVG